jgi:glycosyltransferase involved in cell wall biosynthesis
MKRKLRILYVLPLGGIGGAEKFVLSLCENHDKDLFDITVCILFSGEKVASKIEKLGIEVVRLHMKNGFDFVRAAKLFKIIRNRKIDIVNIHGQNPLSKLFCVTSFAPAIIHTDHGTTIGSPIKRRKRVVIFNRLINPYIDFFIAISNNMKISLQKRERVPGKKIVLIYNGVDVDNISKTTCDRNQKLVSLGIPKNKTKIFGTIGRLVDEKQYPLLFEALSIFKLKHRDFMTLIIGDGPLRKRLEDIVVKFGLEENVLFLGERDDVYDLLDVIDIFIFSSGGEAFSITILEAMCKAKPIVAFDVEGVNEAVKNGVNGLLEPFGENEKFAGSIQKLYENNELATQMGSYGYKIVKEKFNIQRNVKELEKLYQKTECYVS